MQGLLEQYRRKAEGGKSFVYPHNDIERCAKMLSFATRNAEETGGGILVVTEGVFAAKIKSKNVKRPMNNLVKNPTSIF